MSQLTPEDLYSLEEYSKIRPEYRANIIEHKKNRRVNIGEHAALYFEDKLTMQYQVQEMLRIEKIFEQSGIQEELDVYNPLIPDGTNFKATFMIEYSDIEERKKALSKLIGVERALYLQVKGFEPVHPIANEDLDRETPDKTSSVHFVRFELNDEMIAAAKSGVAIIAGINHPAYQHEVIISDSVQQSLIGDLH